MLTNKVITRVDLPHEDAWIEVRQPSLLILQKALRAPIDGADWNWLYLLQSCITAWSYDDELTPEAVGELDGETVTVLTGVLMPKAETDPKNALEASTPTSTVKPKNPKRG